MGFPKHTGRSAESNTPEDDDPVARLMAIRELRLRVGVDEPLGAVSVEVAVDVAGLEGVYSALLSPPHALDLAHQLIEACARLKRAEPSAGPFPAPTDGRP